MKKWIKVSLWVFLTLTVLSAIGNLLQTPEQKEQMRIENERKESEKKAKEEEKKAQKEREEAEAKEKQRVFQICNDKIQESVKSPIDTVESTSSGSITGKLANLWSFACNVEGEVPTIQYIKASSDDLYAKFKEDCLDPMSEFTTGSELIKKNLNDPKSYDHESSRFRVNEDGMFDVIMTFRSKNTSNATVLSVATMQADVGCNARNLQIGN